MEHFLRTRRFHKARLPAAPVLEAIEPRVLLSADSTVVFNELMYHPAGAGSEFVELHNQMGVDMDLSGWSLAEGIQFQFAPGTVLPRGGYLVVAANPAALAASGFAGALGPYTGSLNNAGERIVLLNNNDRLMDEMEYADDDPWPVGADGSGASLAKLNPLSPSGDPRLWRASGRIGGTPGELNFPQSATTDPQANRALGKPVIDGSSSWNNSPFNVPPNAVDNFIAQHVTDGSARDVYGVNYWLGSDGDATEYFTLDLGDAVAIDRIVLRNTHNTQHNDRGTAQFRILASNSVNVSNQLVSPAVILTGTLPNVAGLDPIPGTLFTNANGLTPTTARYLKFETLTANNPSNNVGLNEIEVYSNTPVVSTALAMTEVAAGGAGFSVELFNRGAQPINLTGYRVRSSTDVEHVITNGTLAAGGYLVIGAVQLGFVPVVGDKLFLLTPDGAQLIDAVAVEAQLRGRLANDPTGPLFYPSAATPGAANVFAFEDDVVISEIMYHHPPTYGTAGEISATTLLPFSATWRYEQSGNDLGASWRAPGFDDDDWLSGPGVLGAENAALVEPIRTPLLLSSAITYYFRTTFQFTGDPTLDTVQFRTLIDDGAVIYVNGNEMPRINMPAGGINFQTPANPGVTDAALSGWTTIPGAFLSVGINTLAVEVHQNQAGSSDIVFGLEIEQCAAVSGTPFIDDGEEWIELFNRSAAAIDLSGWRLSDGIEFTFAPGTVLGAGQYLVVSGNAALLAMKYPGVDMVGSFSGNLSNQGERIVLLDAAGNPADVVEYFDDAPWPKAADGGGSSLELRDPFADNAKPEAWAASDEASASEWRTYSYTQTAINPVYSPTIFNFHELHVGLLDAGEVLIDNIRVVEAPGGAARQLIQNGGFEDDTFGGEALKWRRAGTHDQSHVIVDPDDQTNNVMRLIATGPTHYLSNRLETTLKFNGQLAPVVAGTPYTIAFDAKWISGSPQLHTELNYNKVVATTVLEMPALHGTPGAENSAHEANIGPTYESLSHSPVSPKPGEAMTVTVKAADPHGLAELKLWYRVETGPWVSVTMSNAGGTWSAPIPGQTAGKVIRFYVEGVDSLGARSTFPAAGANSHALIEVDDGLGVSGLTHFRIIMTAADSAKLHDPLNILSDDRIGATVVSGGEVFYNAGIRLRGSMFSRRDPATTGFNLAFPADHLFRGVHATVSLKRPGNKEILVKHMNNQAGDIPGMYDDFVYLIHQNNSNRGPAKLSMARFNDIYLDSQFEDGSDGVMYKMEGIRVILTTHNGDPEGIKVPFPPGWVAEYDITDLGDSEEQYRWSILLGNNTAEDDYTSMIALAKVFALTGAALQAAAPTVMDVDQWMRVHAMASLAGIGDIYTQGNPHNLTMYARPEDGKIIALPWDWDFTFNNPTNAPLWGNGNLAKIIALPVFNRLFLGHMLDLMNTTYNTAYMTPWINHYGSLTGENFSSFITYITNRRNFVLSQLPAQFPFAITTNGGGNFTVDADSVTLEGEGWINVREIKVNGAAEPVNITWLDNRRWQVTVPIAFGANVLNLQAVDHQGAVVGSDSITVSSTDNDRPLIQFLRVSELNYHPRDPQPGEMNVDADEFEFIEFVNTSATRTLNLEGVSFSIGLGFTFGNGPSSQLAPGQRIVVVRNLAAFASRYGLGINVAGAYTSGGLNNDTELLQISDPTGAVIQSFTYADRDGWPDEADGEGHTLVVIDATAPTSTWSQPASWRISVQLDGSPGAAEDAVAPVITNVLLAGGAWTAPFLAAIDAFDGRADAAYTLPTGTNAQLAALPWTNINRLSIVFSEHVHITQQSLTVAGANTPDITALINLFAYDAGTFTATWTLAAALLAERLLISVADAVADAAGNRLDGEWSDGVSASSGDGAAGGDAHIRVNVLPGDADQSGSVLGNDVILGRNAQFKSTTASGYNPRLDVNGSGIVLGDDVILIRNRQFASLPAGEPPIPLAAVAQQEVLLFAAVGAAIDATADAVASRRPFAGAAVGMNDRRAARRPASRAVLATLPAIEFAPPAQPWTSWRKPWAPTKA